MLTRVVAEAAAATLEAGAAERKPSDSVAYGRFPPRAPCKSHTWLAATIVDMASRHLPNEFGDRAVATRLCIRFAVDVCEAVREI